MIKKGRSNICRITGKICFGLAILAVVTPGCKKKEVAPTPTAVKVLPLQSRAVQANSSAAKLASVQPKGAVLTTPAPVEAPLPKSAVPAPAKAPAAVPAVAGAPILKQFSSPRLAPPPSAISLDFSNRRDPFKPYVQATPSQQATGGKAGASLKDALPIQRFDVDKFRISGIITGLKENSALVLDPNGKGYVVRAGMQLGNNDGRIKRITDSSVEVEESFRDDNGRVKKRMVKLTLIRKK